MPPKWREIPPRWICKIPRPWQWEIRPRCPREIRHRYNWHSPRYPHNPKTLKPPPMKRPMRHPRLTCQGVTCPMIAIGEGVSQRSQIPPGGGIKRWFTKDTLPRTMCWIKCWGGGG
jgi:hypothetical protein